MIIFMVMAGFIWPVKVSPCVLQHHLNLPSPSSRSPHPASSPSPPSWYPSPRAPPLPLRQMPRRRLEGGFLVRRRGLEGEGTSEGK